MPQNGILTYIFKNMHTYIFITIVEKFILVKQTVFVGICYAILDEFS